jgi:hypothetical protein
MASEEESNEMMMETAKNGTSLKALQRSRDR